jgi:PelA/Pel-15E family pectate lyase
MGGLSAGNLFLGTQKTAGGRALKPNVMRFKFLLLAALALGLAPRAFAAVIGTNVPARPLAAERVVSLPAWKTYLEKSQRERQADQDCLRGELKANGLAEATLPDEIRNADNLPLDKPADWYAGDDARHIAGVIVSFQTPAGGWSKNTDYTEKPRVPGEMFGVESGSAHLAANDFDAPSDPHWSYVGTFDNDATTTELFFLAKVITAAKTGNAAWRKSFLRGLDYVLAAQFPNGGWPQVWPLQGGYHDNITINDDAMVHVLELLQGVAGGQNEFSFVPRHARADARKSFERGMDCLLAIQTVVNGQRTVWCQQNDPLTLEPASARNYEMPALVSSESATIVLFLMNQPKPTPREVAAVHAACAWFEKTRIMGWEYKRAGDEGRILVAAPGSGPLWARFYEIGSNRPIFGDRDKSIHDNVNELSRERRNGYGWYRDTPKPVLERYPKWAAAHPQ